MSGGKVIPFPSYRASSTEWRPEIDDCLRCALYPCRLAQCAWTDDDSPEGIAFRARRELESR